MKRNQIILIGTALAVLAVLAVLYFATRSPAGARSTAPAARAEADHTAAPVSPTSSGDRERPSLPDRETPESRDEAPRHDYIDNSGRMVRDHRRGDRPPLMDSKTEPRNAPLKVDPQVIVSISQSVRPIIRRCSAEVPEGRFGPDAQVQAELRVSIVAGVVSVDEVKVSLSEGDDPDLVSCIHDAAAALSLTAEGHPDVAEKWLTFPYRLRHR